MIVAATDPAAATRAVAVVLDRVVDPPETALKHQKKNDALYKCFMSPMRFLRGHIKRPKPPKPLHVFSIKCDSVNRIRKNRLPPICSVATASTEWTRAEILAVQGACTSQISTR